MKEEKDELKFNASSEFDKRQIMQKPLLCRCTVLPKDLVIDIDFGEPCLK